MKLAKFLEIILLGLSAILFVVFFVSPHSAASDPIIDTYLIWAYVLFFVALVVLLGFLLSKTFSTKKGIINFLLLLVGVVVLVGISYILAPGGEVNTSVAYTEQVSKLSDAALILTYILGGGALVALVGSTIMNSIKNR